LSVAASVISRFLLAADRMLLRIARVADMRAAAAINKTSRRFIDRYCNATL
jgi:hypothetical protein